MIRTDSFSSCSSQDRPCRVFGAQPAPSENMVPEQKDEMEENRKLVFIVVLLMKQHEIFFLQCFVSAGVDAGTD